MTTRMIGSSPVTKLKFGGEFYYVSDYRRLKDYCDPREVHIKRCEDDVVLLAQL
jgi:hypothetical protein